jgi:FkbM family methyltransferase
VAGPVPRLLTGRAVRLRAWSRGTARRVAAATTGAVPLPWLLWFRRSYAGGRPRSLRRALLRPILEVLRHRGLESVGTFSIVDRPEVRLVAADSLVVRRLFWFGERGYEASEAAWWRWFCERSERILELGANIGYYTVQGGLVAPRASYVAVEPHPEVAALLRENLRLNGLDHVDVVEAAAVGRKPASTMELLLTDRDHYRAPTGAYLRVGAEGVDRAASSSVTVELVEVKDLLDGVDLVKLDTEGHEAEILSSVEGYLRRRRPTLFVEIGERTPVLRQLLASLCRSSGYRPYVIDAPAVALLAPEALSRVSPLRRSGTRDLILTTVPMEGVRLPTGRPRRSRLTAGS